ncbi:hypothetical protein EV361DRAFT_874694 [Lentinula raphanica]|nr:hypothetical protein EV361DRAFT_874694 [Lentinula raphanica]
MASSSKPSSSKRPVPKISTADATPLPRKKLSVRPVDSLNFDLLHQVSFDKRLRELGKPPNAVDSLFLPASAEECSVLVNRWKHLPNTASPAFSLRRYTHPDEVSFREVLEQDTDNSRPDTFYPALLTTFCSTFSHGAVSTAEGFQLYQALAFLQRKFARLIKGHLSKQEIHRRLLDLTALRNFSDSLEYYQLYWHGRQNCPLAAVVLVLLICEFCEEHLSGEEYASRVYDQKARDGPGMSMKTRERLLEDIPDSYELETLALPIPLDPSTREGQLLLTVTGRGSPVDKIVHPHTRKVVAPDPSFQPPPGPVLPKLVFLFHDAQQALLHGMQKVRSTGFDLNVVLSRWAEDNPDLPLDYDTLTWLATLFGWDSSCNLVDYLATPEDRARLEAFMHDSLPSPADPVAPATLPAVSSSLLDAPEPPESPRLSRRRPAAATPSNFFSDHEFHTPLPESTIVDDEGEDEAENDEKAEEVSRVSAGRSLLTEYEDESDEDGEPDVETIEPHASEVPNSVKNRK